MATPRREQFHAVVIGIDDYPKLGDANRLAGCANDALAIERFLRDAIGARRERVELLISPRADRAIPEARPATASEIRTALSRVVDRVQSGDEVLLYFAGHGVRVANAVTGERTYALVAADAVLDDAGSAELVSGRELDRFVRELGARSAIPTIVADTCHSGGSTRSVTGQRRAVTLAGGLDEWRLSATAWAKLVTPSSDEAGSVKGAIQCSGWLSEAAGRDWVMLAACRDTESAEEIDWAFVTPGGTASEPPRKLTACLLTELGRVPQRAIEAVRWRDVVPAVKRAMSELGPQCPVLEGQAERVVFGGTWTGSAIGFPVGRGADDRLIIGGGHIHGLDEGAELAIVASESPEIALAGARIVSATPTTSEAELINGAVPDRSLRAVLRRSGTRGRRTRVVVADPDLDGHVMAALATTRDTADWLEISVDAPADLALRTLDGRWVVVPWTPTVTEVTADSVIAYLPSENSYLARALEAGLRHWTRYRAVRDRANHDPELMGLVEVYLRRGTDVHAPPEASTRQAPDDASEYLAPLGAPLWVELRVGAVYGFRLFACLILCSDDGNVLVLWPPAGAEPGMSDQTIFIGESQYAPALPTVRPDQECSRYTFKVIGCTLGEWDSAPALTGEEGGLRIDGTVQDAIETAVEDQRRGGAKDLSYTPTPPPRLWSTWDLPLRVVRERR